jgi:hypothetical protein
MSQAGSLTNADVAVTLHITLATIVGMVPESTDSAVAWDALLSGLRSAANIHPLRQYYGRSHCSPGKSGRAVRFWAKPKKEHSMFSSEENELSALQTALAHSQSWIELHANQRQSLLNFFLIAVAFLFNAYVGALSSHRYLLAGTISLLGAAISFSFTAMDLRNRELTRAGEASLKEIQDRLASKCNLPTLRIIVAIDRPSHAWLSMGKLIRSIHAATGLVFIGVTAYAFFA